MTKNSIAVYLGNTDNKDCEFTPGMKYEIHDFEDGYIGVYDNNDVYHYIKNGAFHSFMLRVDFDGFVTETECEVTATRSDKNPGLRCYINGHEVDIIEFENVRFKVRQLDEDGVKCDTIKFEVKFQ